MGRTNKIVDGWDTLGSEKDAGNALLLNFWFKCKEIKGKKRPNFPVKKVLRPYKTVHPIRQKKMAVKEVSSEAVVVFPYKYDGKERNIEILEAVLCEDDEILEAVPREDDEVSKKVISEMNEEVLLLEKGDKKVKI